VRNILTKTLRAESSPRIVPVERAFEDGSHPAEPPVIVNLAARARFRQIVGGDLPFALLQRLANGLMPVCV
jgi:hypothetical protein